MRAEMFLRLIYYLILLNEIIKKLLHLNVIKDAKSENLKLRNDI